MLDVIVKLLRGGVQVNDYGSDNNDGGTTAILGKAVLGKMIIGKV